jgi:glucose/arabinose dehydrogenase
MRRTSIALMLGGALVAAAGIAAAVSADRSDAAAPFSVTKIADGFGSPVYLAQAPGDARLFVVEQAGIVRPIVNGKPGPALLDIRSKVTAGGEQGLLSVAFHPGYAKNGRLFVYYTDRSGDQTIWEYKAGPGARKVKGGARQIMRMDDQFANHNGGLLLFGPDGFLYTGTGDGGGGGDPLHSGQRLDTLLGKLLRIDVDRSAGGKHYAIPDDNPFRGTAGARGEIYAYGLRNPWRFSFDRKTGALWIGDVGQNAYEEVDYAPKGKARGLNFGWNTFEARHAFAGGDALRAGSKHTPPVAEYPHDAGCSVTGGYAYRGDAIPALRGQYLYADYCSARLWTMKAGGRPVERSDVLQAAGGVDQIASFGQDSRGELYIVSQSGSIWKVVKP